MAQLVTRIDDALAEALDELVASGAVASRSEAVRIGLQQLFDQHRRAKIGQAIRDGYLRLPQTEAEVPCSSAALIAEEPW